MDMRNSGSITAESETHSDISICGRNCPTNKTGTIVVLQEVPHAQCHRHCPSFPKSLKKIKWGIKKKQQKRWWKIKDWLKQLFIYCTVSRCVFKIRQGESSSAVMSCCRSTLLNYYEQIRKEQNGPLSFQGLWNVEAIKMREYWKNKSHCLERELPDSQGTPTAPHQIPVFAATALLRARGGAPLPNHRYADMQISLLFSSQFRLWHFIAQ